MCSPFPCCSNVFLLSLCFSRIRLCLIGFLLIKIAGCRFPPPGPVAPGGSVQWPCFSSFFLPVGGSRLSSAPGLPAKKLAATWPPHVAAPICCPLLPFLLPFCCAFDAFLLPCCCLFAVFFAVLLLLVCCRSVAFLLPDTLPSCCRSAAFLLLLECGSWWPPVAPALPLSCSCLTAGPRWPPVAPA